MPAQAVAQSIITPELLNAAGSAAVQVYKMHAFTLVSSITWLIMAIGATVAAWGYGLYRVYDVLQNSKGTSISPIGGVVTTIFVISISPILFLLMASFFEIAFEQDPFALVRNAVGMTFASIVSAPEFSQTPYLKAMAAALSMLAGLTPWLLASAFLANLVLSFVYFFTHINIDLLVGNNEKTTIFFKFVLVLGVLSIFSVISYSYASLVNFIFFHGESSTTFASFGSVTDSITLIKTIATTAMRWGLTGSFN